jgi:rod shape-determining protein MreD
VVFGIMALFVQGVIAASISARFLPELSFLVAISMGLVLRSPALALAVAFVLGAVTDLFSASWLGLHAFSRVAVVLTVLLAGRHLSLRGGPTVVALAGGLTAGNAALLALITRIFGAGGADELGRIGSELVPQIIANGLAAPFVVSTADRFAAWLGDEDGRRLLRFDTRSFPV